MFDPTGDGPYYEDFRVGATLPQLPGITLTDADNALYRAITGDQHRPSAAVTSYAALGGSAGRALANPALVAQCSIGQSTMATRRAVANLYYRSVRALRPVHLGDTLTTTTTVLGLHDASPKGEMHRGKVWLGISTATAAGTVLEYERCALVRARGTLDPGHADAIPGPSDPTPLDALENALPDWDLADLPGDNWAPGTSRDDPLRDHIDLAPALARMTFNQAAVHRDHTQTADGRRLVYGGHVQGLAQASLTRVLPGLAWVAAWDGCNHLAPAHEGDLLAFRHTLVEARAVRSGRLLRIVSTASTVADGTAADVLRWTPIVWAP